MYTKLSFSTIEGFGISTGNTYTYNDKPRTLGGGNAGGIEVPTISFGTSTGTSSGTSTDTSSGSSTTISTDGATGGSSNTNESTQGMNLEDNIMQTSIPAQGIDTEDNTVQVSQPTNVSSISTERSFYSTNTDKNKDKKSDEEDDDDDDSTNWFRRIYKPKRKIKLVENKNVHVDRSNIKVAFPISGKPMSYISSTGNKEGLNFQAWKLIEPSVKESTQKEIEYIVVKEAKVDELVAGLKNGTYDIVIGDYGTNPIYSSDINYTASYMARKDVGVYKPTDKTYLEFELIKKVGNVLFWPLIGLFIVAFIASIYAYMFSKKKVTYSGAFLQMLNGILGDRGGLFSGVSYKVIPKNNSLKVFFGILIVIFTFFYLFYLQSIAITKSLQVISKNKDPFLYPSGKKVLVPKGSAALKGLRDCCQIITVEAKTKNQDVNSIANEFNERAEAENLIGFYHSGPEVSHWITNHPDFIMSDTKFAVPSPISFMVSKHRPELLHAVNESISKMNWSGALNHECKKYINRVCFASQY